MLRPRTLVLYGTTDGHTRKIATALAESVRSLDHDVDVINARSHVDPNPADYDAVIVASPVRARRYQRDVRRWVKAHATTLNRRHTAFVSVCLSVLDKSESTRAALARMLEEFVKETGWRPTVVKVVPGALLYTRYNWITRWIMKRIVARAHGDTDTRRDYEYTDWSDLRAFAREFASARPAPATGRLDRAS